MPSLHGTMGSSRYLTHDDVPEATDKDDISIHTTEEMEKYESLHYREFAHTHIYDANVLERVALGEELPIILQTDEPHLGSRLLTFEFLMTFEIVEKNRKSFMKFCLFGKSFGCDFSRFSELLDFSNSCLPESSAMRNFNKVEFSDAISGKSTRLRFSDIHNPSLRFLHRWDTGYGGGYSGYHEGGNYYPSQGYPEPSLRAGTSASARYHDWYTPLERYISYGVDQAEHTVEGIGWLERRMDHFAHVQTDMQASIDSQTSVMHDLFGHFGINPDA
jgi:hypothetical protein